ncbi:MAG: putative serine/threonine protein kinase [Archaeoglobi archaeon]|nr:hypothetical protein [Candidatus Mnemosynella bozhongmuii]MDK2781491.1 putative serine/threonine protein kinase [Archaeoglobi archaeon]
MKGRHSRVYLIGDHAIKVFHPELSKNFRREVYFLELLKPFGFVPPLVFADFTRLAILMKRIRGKFLPEALNRRTLSRCLEICFILDRLGVQKEEMNHPQRHIIVSGDEIFFLDFERSHLSERPSNLTQFCSYLRSLGFEVEIRLLKEYKRVYSSKLFERIRESLLSLI